VIDPARPGVAAPWSRRRARHGAAQAASGQRITGDQ
jgi:hypothetical protein